MQLGQYEGVSGGDKMKGVDDVQHCILYQNARMYATQLRVKKKNRGDEDYEEKC